MRDAVQMLLCFGAREEAAGTADKTAIKVVALGRGGEFMLNLK